ncbi:thioredoxin family protein [Sphingobium sp. HBC34]|uniref:Thioredoxin family protein n=1 Tax=Sphingobium cyanobacteriorum TaxID=3063954 RepID=A0ABT8ZRN5_9SPHN|nr:thioredoxin family protein [Sphingobium sp. HBC34]MDO7837209.1 thioredoxin family protein [Sphingobium sp. HBC34]
MFRLIKNFFAMLAMLVAVPALANPGWTTYSPDAFSRAQASGKTIVVDVHATWCPTCRAQEPILDALRSEPRLKNAIFVKVDFDTEKAFLRQHRIPRQSTVLVFKGTRETARSIAETRPEQLRAAVLGGV